MTLPAQPFPPHARPRRVGRSPRAGPREGGDRGPVPAAEEPLEPELLAFIEALARADAAADYAAMLAQAGQVEAT